MVVFFLLTFFMRVTLFFIYVFQNVKAFVASHSLLNVHEVASWLLEMNQELLSVGSKRRRTGGSVRGNASSSQADEEQMNRVEEEDEQQQQNSQQQQQQQEQEEEEDQHIVVNGDVDGPGSVDRSDSQHGQLEENNNSCVIADQESVDQPEEHEPAEDEEEDEDHVCDVDEDDEEEMDQDSDDFDQSDDSSREDERRNSRDIPNSNSIMDITLHQKSTLFHTKTKVSAVYSWDILHFLSV